MNRWISIGISRFSRPKLLAYVSTIQTSDLIPKQYFLSHIIFFSAWIWSWETTNDILFAMYIYSDENTTPCAALIIFLQGIYLYLNIQQDVYTRRNSNPLRSKRTNKEYNEKNYIFFAKFSTVISHSFFKCAKNNAR